MELGLWADVFRSHPWKHPPTVGGTYVSLDGSIVLRIQVINPFMLANCPFRNGEPILSTKPSEDISNHHSRLVIRVVLVVKGIGIYIDVVAMIRKLPIFRPGSKHGGFRPLSDFCAAVAPSGKMCESEAMISPTERVFTDIKISVKQRVGVKRWEVETRRGGAVGLMAQI